MPQHPRPPPQKTDCRVCLRAPQISHPQFWLACAQHCWPQTHEPNAIRGHGSLLHPETALHLCVCSGQCPLQKEGPQFPCSEQNTPLPSWPYQSFNPLEHPRRNKQHWSLSVLRQQQRRLQLMKGLPVLHLTTPQGWPVFARADNTGKVPGKVSHLLKPLSFAHN